MNPLSRLHQVRPSLIAVSLVLLFIGRTTEAVNEPQTCIPPSISVQQPQPVCEGQTVRMFLSGSASTPLHIQWRKNGVNLSSGPTGNGSIYVNVTGDIFSITHVAAADAVSASSGFDCVVSNACGSMTSTPVGLKVDGPVSATIYGARQVCAGSQTIYVGPDDPYLGYNWSISGQGTIIGASSDQSIFVLAGPTGSYTLSLTVTNGNACTNVASDTATISIFSPATIVAQPASVMPYPGGSATFSVGAIGSSLTYQWQKNGVDLINDANITGADSATLTISHVGYGADSPVCQTLPSGNSGGLSFGTVVAGRTYDFQASGCAVSSSGGPQSDPDGNQYSDSGCTTFLQKQPAASGFVCPGLTAFSLVGKIGSTCIQLGNSGRFVSPASGTLILYINDDAFDDNSGSWNVCITSTNMEDTYDVVVSSGCESQTSDPATLKVSAPNAVVSGDAWICPGQSATIRATLTGTGPWTIIWSDFTSQYITVGPVATRTVSPTTTTTYAIYQVSGAGGTGAPSGSAVVTVGDFMGSVSTPTFTPDGGKYVNSLSVTVSCASAGTYMFYTTNGLMPTMDDPYITSGGVIAVRQPTLLRARAFSSSLCASDIKGGLYEIGPLVVAGEYDSFLVQTNETVWGWGDNVFREVSSNAYVDSYSPQPAVILSDIRALGAGGSRTMAVNTNGTAWCWGLGYSGNGDQIYRAPPTLITDLSNVRSVAASPQHYWSDEGSRFGDFSLVLKADGTVWAFGENSYGQLGWGNAYDWGSRALLPIQTIALSGVIAIAAGGDVSMALCSNGTVWVWGDYTDAFFDNFSHHDYDTLASTGTPMRVEGLANIVAIALGYQHAIALDQNGVVWTWGWDDQGQLGTGDSYVNSEHGWDPAQVPGLGNVISIAAGDYYSVAVTASGQVYTWGANKGYNDRTGSYVNGELGTGSTSNYVSSPQIVSSLNGIQDVSAADAHTLARGNYQGAEVVWAWGDNSTGQLGDGTTENRATPVLVHLPFDTDGDGLPDWQECQLELNPLDSDQNNDGILDGIELAFGFDPSRNDVDGDGFSNLIEMMNGTNPFDPSSCPTPPSDNVFPVITLIEPADAVLIP